MLAAGSGFSKDFSAWRAHLDQMKKDHPHNYDRTSELIQPQYVLECLNEVVNGDAIFTTGVGQHQMWAAQYRRFEESAIVSDFRFDGNDGFRIAGGNRRAVRKSRTRPSSTSMATAAFV